MGPNYLVVRAEMGLSHLMVQDDGKRVKRRCFCPNTGKGPAKVVINGSMSKWRPIMSGLLEESLKDHVKLFILGG